MRKKPVKPVKMAKTAGPMPPWMQAAQPPVKPAMKAPAKAGMKRPVRKKK